MAARKFFLFGSTFNAQDFWIVLFLGTALLFYVTNKSPAPARIALAVDGPVAADARLGSATVTLPSLGDVRVPLVISIDGCTVRPDLSFTLTVSNEAGLTRRQPIRFVAAPLGAGERANCNR